MPAATAVIRDATHTDLGAIAAIFSHYVTETVVTFEEVPPTVDDWARRLADLTERGLPFLVAEVAEVAEIPGDTDRTVPGDTRRTVAGYAYAGPWRPKPAYRHTAEDAIYLAPGRTGAGLGAALLGALLTRCAEAGVRQVVAVIADSGSDASAALHRRFGFTPAGTLAGVGRKHGRWIDTHLMQCDLTTGTDPQTEPGRRSPHVGR
ncbi:GNAT family N-acetyltransferase [Streptomyces antimycoticus]|uniref:GNAT family N-acetyltransferase n=1 Tax=Streptomyces antimycoticus TaxID=68175 RepID=UPI00256FC2B1|nr:GNAT family N-acetyltransferase [Streptomyces antimycoticus]WJD97775.1 N-acetyltransferase family protein [Streptomyces antimycoticus]WTA83429.1 GNAT family N-acetyltransferase [Streptomyces antimycoticus]